MPRGLLGFRRTAAARPSHTGRRRQASLTSPNAPERWWKRNSSCDVRPARQREGDLRSEEVHPGRARRRRRPLLLDVGDVARPVHARRGGDRGDHRAVPGKAMVAQEQRAPEFGRALPPEALRRCRASGSSVKWVPRCAGHARHRGRDEVVVGRVVPGGRRLRRVDQHLAHRRLDVVAAIDRRRAVAVARRDQRSTEPRRSRPRRQAE